MRTAARNEEVKDHSNPRILQKFQLPGVASLQTRSACPSCAVLRPFPNPRQLTSRWHRSRIGVDGEPIDRTVCLQILRSQLTLVWIDEEQEEVGQNIIQPSVSVQEMRKGESVGNVNHSSATVFLFCKSRKSKDAHNAV